MRQSKRFFITTQLAVQDLLQGLNIEEDRILYEGGENTLKYVTALLIKFVMVTLVLWVVLGAFFNISFGDILITSILLTGAAFLIGDLFILPKYGNPIATIADFGLALLGVWLLGALLFEQPISLGAAAFLSAIVIAIGEFFFHMYLQKQGTAGQSQKNDKNSNNQNSASAVSTYKYQTEAGSDVAVRPAVQKYKIDQQGAVIQTEKKKIVSVDQYQTEAGSDVVVGPADQKNKMNQKQDESSKPRKNQQDSTDQYRTEAGADMSADPAGQKTNSNKNQGASAQPERNQQDSTE